MDYANTTNAEFIVDPKVLFHGWWIYSYLHISWSSECQGSVQIGSLTTLWHDHIACIDDTACLGRKNAFWLMSIRWTVKPWNHLIRGFPSARFNLMQYQAIEITFKDQLKTLQLYKEKTSKSLVLRYFYWQPCCTPWLFLFKALYFKFAVSIIRISNRG